MPPERTLTRQGSLAVYIAGACEVPWILQEIGWLREQTFRAVGEGTGKALDLDRFDNHYQHLFLFDEKEGNIAGAYRLARTDRVIATEGIGGLYTHTLFDYRRSFIDAIAPAIELGRSFVRVEYQRSAHVLPLIWRGIGEYIARNPQYASLFGPVSISKEYDHISRSLIVEYLRHRCSRSDLAAKVSARHRFRYAIPEKELAHCRVTELNALSQLLSAIEDDGKGLPILLKHYLRLNGQLLSFNVDADFSDVTDGLVLVDLRDTHPAVAKRYLGKEGYARFCHFHAADSL